MSLENGIITISHVCLENRHICCLAKALHFFVATHSVATFLKSLSQHTLLKNRIWRNYCFSIGVPTKQKATSHCGIITSRENVNQQMLEGEAEPTSNPATGCQKCSISGQDPVPSQNHVFELQIKKPSGFCPVRDLKKKKITLWDISGGREKNKEDFWAGKIACVFQCIFGHFRTTSLTSRRLEKIYFLFRFKWIPIIDPSLGNLLRRAAY